MDKKAMVISMLKKYELAKDSDEALFDCIVMNYFEWDSNFVPDIVAFINTITRIRRQLQMKWQYKARKEVTEKRQAYSKLRAKDYKATKKDLSKVSFEKFIVDWINSRKSK